MAMRVITVLALVVFIGTSCTPDVGPIDLSGPYTLTNLEVFAHNSTGDQFTVTTGGYFGNQKVPYGSSVMVQRFTIAGSVGGTDTFDVLRRDVVLARVSYQVLKFPTPVKGELTTQEATIVVREDTPDVFTTVVHDTLWVKVLGVEQRP